MRSGAGVRSATVTVGRETEVDLLVRAVEGVRAKRSSCILLVGEGGVGKTRLLAEATVAARRAGVAVAAGRAAIAPPAPFALISEALRSRLRGHPLTLPVSPFDHGVRLILPEWGEPTEPGSDLAAGQLRLLALEGTVRILREMAIAGDGAVLVLDDLHAADRDSLEVVRYVASAAVEGLAILAAMRPGESGDADELLRGLRGGEADVIDVEALPPRAIGDLVTHLLDTVPPAELVADVLGRTDGLAWAEETLAIALTLQGDPRAALEVLAPAIDRARALRLDQLGFLLVAQAGALSLLGSPFEDVFAEAEAVAPAPDLRMFTAAIRADIALREGRYEEAVSGLESVEELMKAMPGAAPMDSLCYLVWALAAAGRMEEARAALRRATAMPDLARWYPRPVLVSAGRALLAGDAAGVDAAIAAAVGPMPFDVAIMLTIGARVLGGEVVAGWLRRALDIYEAAGAVGHGERARRLLRDAGGPIPRRRKAAASVPPELAGRGVTAREAEVLRLLGQGLSNAEIASGLFLSVRTVETHVSSLLAKLQLRGRGNLIAISSAMTFDPST